MENQGELSIAQRGGIRLRDTTSGGRVRTGGARIGPLNLTFDRVARALIWVSLGLGLMEVLMPRRVQKMVGVRRGNHAGLIRAAGFRELMNGLLIFMQPRPHRGVWARVAGDAMDLGLLGAAFTSPRVERDRLKIATASILGVTALDALTATQLTRERSKEKGISALTQADLDGRTRNGGFRAIRSITIHRTPDELYHFWRNFENLPQIMYHLEDVRVMDDEHSHWVAKAPAGTRVEWDAEITEDRENELIAWQSTSKASVPNSGVVRFEPGPSGRGTVVRVEIEYRPPAGAVGRTVAMLFGEEPGQQVKADLTRFKQMMETGEIMRSDASPEGYGQKAQRPAQPLPGDQVKQAEGLSFERSAVR